MENPACCIRAFSPADTGAIRHIFRLNVPAFFAAEEEPELLHYLQNEAQHYFVLEYNNQIAGCGGFNLMDDGITARISWDIFHPQMQGMGLGTALTGYRMHLLHNMSVIQNVIVRTSQLAYRFYEKQGFVLCEKVHDFWAPGYDLYVMELHKK